jgi:hypothetical protein
LCRGLSRWERFDRRRCRACREILGRCRSAKRRLRSVVRIRRTRPERGVGLRRALTRSRLARAAPTARPPALGGWQPVGNYSEHLVSGEEGFAIRVDQAKERKVHVGNCRHEGRNWRTNVVSCASGVPSPAASVSGCPAASNVTRRMTPRGTFWRMGACALSALPSKSPRRGIRGAPAPRVGCDGPARPTATRPYRLLHLSPGLTAVDGAAEDGR